MFEDVAFYGAQSLAGRLMRRLGIPENWRPKSKLANTLLWLLVLAGAMLVIYLTVAK